MAGSVDSIALAARWFGGSSSKKVSLVWSWVQTTILTHLWHRRIKLERATFHLADKSAAFHPRSHRNAIPRTDELNSAVSHMGAADDDPFAEAMGEASNRAAQVDQAKIDIQRNQDDTSSGREVTEEDDIDEDLEDRPEEDEKQRRLAQTLATGDIIEEVSAFSSFFDYG